MSGNQPKNRSANDAADIFRALNRRQFLMAGMAGVSGIGCLSGCGTMARRGQSPDDTLMSATEIESGSADIYVGDLAGTWGLNNFKVEGVGLVTQLRGTGSDPAPSGPRTMLQSEMQTHRVPKPNKLLAGSDTSLVLVRGFMPPAIRKGDRFDIQLETMPRSETTSLEHGFLMQARMKQMEVLGGRLKQGGVSALAKGSLVVDSIFDPDNEELATKARIFGGAVAMQDRPVGLAVQSDSKSIQATTRISRNINARFHISDNGGRAGVATPKNDQVINLVVPMLYKDNVTRYLAVVNSIIFRESSDLLTRIDRLEKELLEPSLAQRAAMRLEAIGKKSIAALNRGLRSQEVESQFCAAESLAYLGESNCSETLGRIAAEVPELRWRAMAALSTMDDLEAGIALSDLLHHEAIATRYGAFRSIHTRSPHDPAINEVRLPNSDFAYHLIPTNEQPMIHFARSRRAEIVLFGHDQQVNDNFLFVENGLTVKAEDGVLKISQFSKSGEDRRLECSKSVDDLIRNLHQLGMGYGDLLKILRKASQRDALDTQLVIGATPGRKPIFNSEAEVETEQVASGPIPELFKDDEVGAVRQASFEEDYDAVNDEFDAEAHRKQRPFKEKFKRLFRK